MSTLSWSIIALVVVVLVIVIAHNLWQNHRSRQQEGRLSLRKGHFEDDPDTLTGEGRRRSRVPDGGRDRRDPVLAGESGGRQVPPSLAARPARVRGRDEPGEQDAWPHDDLHHEGPRRGEDSARYPSLGVDDEDFVETPFENPAAVRPWSSSEDAASRRARQQAASRTREPHLHEDEAPVGARRGTADALPSAAGRVGRDEGPQAGGRQSAGHPAGHDQGGALLAAAARAEAGRASPRGEYQPFAPPRPPAAPAAAWQDEAADGTAGMDAEAAAAPWQHEGGRSGQMGQRAPRHEAVAFGDGIGAHGIEGDERAGHGVHAGHVSSADHPAHPAEAGGVAGMPAADEAHGPADPPDGTGAVAGADQDADPQPDALVEHVVILEPPAPVNTDRLVVLTSSLRHVGSKPVRIEVERLGGHWTTLTAGEKAVRLRCSLLLANRQGPLNAVELSDFNAAIESLASQLQAPVSIPDMAPILRNARDLDTLAARLDTQVEVMVELPEAAEASRVSSLVRQLGLSERGNGRYEAYADSGDMLFALAFNKARDQIDFVLDVPRTAERHEAWEGMVACASSMAQGLGGRLVDSSGRGMSVGMIKAVSRQLAQRYAQLAQVGLSAGGSAAMRVFH